MPFTEPRKLHQDGSHPDTWHFSYPAMQAMRQSQVGSGLIKYPAMGNRSGVFLERFELPTFSIFGKGQSTNSKEHFYAA